VAWPYEYELEDMMVVLVVVVDWCLGAEASVDSWKVGLSVKQWLIDASMEAMFRG
jgi:hypothetical protein